MKKKEWLEPYDWDISEEGLYLPDKQERKCIDIDSALDNLFFEIDGILNDDKKYKGTGYMRKFKRNKLIKRG
jgi:hypothetical protein